MKDHQHECIYGCEADQMEADFHPWETFPNPNPPGHRPSWDRALSARRLDEVWEAAVRELPPEYHLESVRRQDQGYVATAWYRGDDIVVGGARPGEAIINLVAECTIRYRRREAVA